jgi:hypothetical protein
MLVVIATKRIAWGAREVEDAGVNGAIDLVLKGARERDLVLKGARERSPVGAMDLPPRIRWGRLEGRRL